MTTHTYGFDQVQTPLGAPGDVVRSLASALVWVDTAIMSLDSDEPREVRAALTNARLQLRGTIRRLRGPQA